MCCTLTKPGSHLWGGGEKGCYLGKEGAKRYGTCRVAMELTRGRVLLPPVMTSVEVPYNMKENRMMGLRGRNLLEKCC